MQTGAGQRAFVCHSTCMRIAALFLALACTHAPSPPSLPRTAPDFDLIIRNGETIDARNQAVAPGFIDLLGDSERSVLIDPHLEGKIRQGVTTEVTGEGHSPGPIDEAMAAEINRTRLPGFPDATWRTLADFMRTVEKRGSAINFAFYVGAANPREIVLGTASVSPTPAQLAEMQRMVSQAMDEGATGLSS